MLPLNGSVRVPIFVGETVTSWQAGRVREGILPVVADERGRAMTQCRIEGAPDSAYLPPLMSMALYHGPKPA